MAKQTEFVKRNVKIEGDNVVMNLTAKDVCTKDEFIELYNSRVQSREQLKNNLEQARKQLNAIIELEKDTKVKELVNIIGTNKKTDAQFFDKVFMCYQKEYTLQQMKNIEKALKMLELEMEDITPMYQKIKGIKNGKL